MAPPPLNGEVLLAELDSESSDWRVHAMRISVHEQIFRTGKIAVHEPYWFWGSEVIASDILERARVIQGMQHMWEPLPLEERLEHLHTALKLHNVDWYVFSFTNDDASEMLLFTSMSLGRLYGQGAPYLLDVEIERGPLLTRSRYSVVNHQDAHAMFHIPVMRKQAVEMIQGMWSSDLVSLALQCEEHDPEFMATLRQAGAINSLDEASDMFASVVLIGDRLMDRSDEPWKSPYWGITREAAGLWFDLEERRKQMDPDYEEPSRETMARCKKWRNASRPTRRAGH